MTEYSPFAGSGRVTNERLSLTTSSYTINGRTGIDYLLCNGRFASMRKGYPLSLSKKTGPSLKTGRGLYLHSENWALLHTEQNTLVHHISDTLREEEGLEIRHRKFGFGLSQTHLAYLQGQLLEHPEDIEQPFVAG